MNRRLLLAAAALAAPVLAAVPAARAQTADADWNAAYRLVLDRDWARADTALAAFLDRYPGDANASAARFWTCFASEQQNRLPAAYDCYHSQAQATPTDRWTTEARTRLVAVAARMPHEMPRFLTRAYGTPAVVTRGTVSRSGSRSGRSYVITVGPSGEPDTLFFRGGGAQMDSVLRTLDGYEGSITGQSVRLAEQAEWMRAQGERIATGSAMVIWNSGRSATDELPSDERVAVLAVEALGRRGEGAAVPDLVDLAETGSTPAIRGAAFSALGRIGTPEAARALLAASRRATAAGAGALTPEAYQGLVYALSRTAQEGGASAAGVVEEIERIARIPGLRAAAIGALARIEAGEAVAALERFAGDAALAGEVRVAAVDGIGRTGEARAVPVLVRLARGDDAALARTAVSALSRIDAPEAREALLSLARLRR